MSDNTKQLIKRSEEFVEQFEEDHDDASHLINAKLYFRKAKNISIALVVLMYVVSAAVTIADIDTGSSLVTIPVGALFLAGTIGAIVSVLLYIDAWRYDITNDELALHELARAVSVFHQDNPDTEDLIEHLDTAWRIIENHDARLFSRHKTEELGSYVEWLNNEEPDSLEDTKFKSVFDNHLYNLTEERKFKFEWYSDADNTLLNDRGFFSTLSQSILNIFNQVKKEKWTPIVLVLIFGFGIFFLYNEQLGYMATIALLTIISISSQDG